MEPFALFGAFFKEMRARTGLPLRKFCLTHGVDPGNLSKIERGLLPPPASREKLGKYAAWLGLKEGTDEWYEFFDLAAACSGKIPPDVMSNAELVQKLPLVFRTLRGQKVPEEQLDELAELIRKA
jgi:transcriptional regulator with XRE-family HTH domain